MVTLGSIQPTSFQAFHGSGPYDTLNFRSFEMALNDVPDIATPSEDYTSTEGRGQEPPKAPYRGPMAALASTARSGIADEVVTAPATAARLESRLTLPQNSSTSDGHLRPSQPEPQSWHPLPQTSDEALSDASCSFSRADRGADCRLRASSWHAADMRSGRSPTFSNGSTTHHHLQVHCFSPRSTKRESRPSSEEDKPSNEILDGSDVLQQISNVTSTEPSNEREVFVGGLRESEDSVHITEEELATYFSKFGVIESVSINRDDRTHRGRGFAFVKFFQESAALNAVVADASTHVIRGTTVSVQWSRGAKDGGDRPRRRNSSNSGSVSGNGGSPRSGRSSSKSGMFLPKGHRGGGGSCGSGCSRGFSPLRSRSQGHLHQAGSGGAGIPYSYCGGGHGGDHLNQPMVCVVVPAQRAAALGLSHLPQHAMGPCTSRGSPPRDVHFPTLAHSTSAGSAHGHGHGRYPSHTRSHSYSIPPTSHGHNSGGAGGGYSHHASQGADQHLAVGPQHHIALKTSHSYNVPPPMHMSPVYRERRERSESRGYQVPLNSGSSSATGGAIVGGHPLTEYERSKYDMSVPSTSYPPPGWSGDGAGIRGMGHETIRSQSPPTAVRSAHGTRNGGGAPRPVQTQSRGYDKQYPPSRYSPASGPVDSFPPGIPLTGRRHSGSSLLAGRDSMRQDALAASNYFYSLGDHGNEHAYDHDFSYAGPSRLA